MKKIISFLIIGFLIIGGIGSSASFLQKSYLGQSANRNQYDMVIIAPKCFKKEIQPLIDHKNSYGVRTYLMTTEEIYNEYKGRNQPEKIKYFIKDTIETKGISYVLLGGGKKGQTDKWYVPVRYIYMNDPILQNKSEDCILSDLYFADIYCDNNFSSWDNDQDGRYGEWYDNQFADDKDIDLYPDVALGRLPFRNSFEVTIMVNKIIEYETTTFGKSWFYDMLVYAGDTYPEIYNPKWKGFEGEIYGDNAIENMTGFNAYRFYTSDGSLSKLSDVTKSFSHGAGFVYFVGHGTPKTWSVINPDGETWFYGLKMKNIPFLSNDKKYPIVVLSGCSNLKFDVDIFNIFNYRARLRDEATFECIGWRITRKIYGGSIATLGTISVGYTKEDKDSFSGGINEIEVQFFKQYGQNNIDILGDIWIASLNWYIDKYPVNWNTKNDEDSWVDAHVVETWSLFGDPSLKIGGYLTK